MKKRGHIAQRGPDRHLVRWRIKDELTGKSRQVSETVYGDYGKAHAFLSAKLNAPTAAPAIPERTFRSYAEGEWSRYVAEHWKSSTQITGGSFVKRHIVPHFGDMLLSEIRPTTIEAFQTEMEKKGLGRKTRRNLHAILTKMFAYAVDDLELIAKNPVKKGLAPPLEKREKPALTEEQLVRLFDVVPIRYKAFFMVLGLTGVRMGEGLGLRWEDIDFAGRELHVKRAIYRGREQSPKTAASLRRRPVMPELNRALLNHKAMATYTEPSDYVFASSTGRPFRPDQLREALQAALKTMGIKFEVAHADGMHLLRHSSGSMVYRHTNGDVKATQAWLGHSNSRVTLDIYTHLAKDQEQKTAERLAQGIFVQPEAPGIVH